MALSLGVGLLGLGLTLSLGLNYVSTLFIGLGALVYVVVYTWWLKRRSPWNIVVGGASGSFAVLAGWSAVAGSLGWPALALALVIFLWTPVHFWSFAIAHRKEYAAAGVPMLPVVRGERGASRWIALHCLLVVAVSLSAFRGAFGPVYLGAAIPGGLALLAVVAWLNLAPGRRPALATFMASNLYLVLLFGGMLADALA